MHGNVCVSHAVRCKHHINNTNTHTIQPLMQHTINQTNDPTFDPSRDSTFDQTRNPTSLPIPTSTPSSISSPSSYPISSAASSPMPAATLLIMLSYPIHHMLKLSNANIAQSGLYILYIYIADAVYSHKYMYISCKICHFVWSWHHIYL